MDTELKFTRILSSVALVLFIAVLVVGCGQAKETMGIVTVGRTDCVPCQTMMGIIEEINTGEFSNLISAKFVDAGEDYSALERYGVDAFPTTIFFDENGDEFYRQIRVIELQDIYEKFGLSEEQEE
ncbi:MAG TPA: thioredoxin family protein [Caldisericia bacterium]|nr:thioredoxin family protein [Caldisericia bacterium]HPF48961.1 thioredoxin family protein [Caldisericia bacterium]HPI83175.1 thioredoxin family protein [Caldisericia bacterium]HPQ92402.1 thioredoxin family protein [Caldisericia bacterium]HRV74500.1 thioredoxin family protein [Caldisericia bacterium]